MTPPTTMYGYAVRDLLHALLHGAPRPEVQALLELPDVRAALERELRAVIQADEVIAP